MRRLRHVNHDQYRHTMTLAAQLAILVIAVPAAFIAGCRAYDATKRTIRRHHNKPARIEEPSVKDAEKAMALGFTLETIRRHHNKPARIERHTDHNE